MKRIIAALISKLVSRGRVFRCLWCGLFIFLQYSAVFAVGSPPVALSSAWPSPGSPFYGVHITGSPFPQAIFARFDTEADTLIVPQGCVNMANVTVINPNTTDEWGNPAEILLGDVTLNSADGSTHYTAHMPFFAETGKSCSYWFKNFGVGMSVFPNPQQQNNGYSRLCGANQTCRYTPAQASNTTSCVGGFFNYYTYPAGLLPGFTISAYKTNQPMVTIGIVSSGPLTYQLPHRPTFNCIGNKTLPACTGIQFWGTSVPNIDVKIGSVLLPQRQIMIDTGGGLLLARDDTQGTYTKALQSILSPCPSNITFLKGCNCVSAGEPIVVSNENGGFTYSYSTTNIAQAQQFAAAICPNSAFNSGSQAPFIFPNGVNLGFAFFNLSHTVSYNMSTCTVNAN